MSKHGLTRRGFLAGAGAACAAAALPKGVAAASPDDPRAPGSQRLSLDQLQKWEALQYGMFIHFGMSTFVGNEIPDGKAPAATYAPDRLNVDQWISVARDAGMKYAVLTAKHAAGHCLWPSKYTDYTVAHSGDKTDVVEAFCKACEKRGVLPGLYYCSWDNHNRFGSVTPSDGRRLYRGADLPASEKDLPAYTTSVYQGFQTAQVTELLTQYGPIAEVWIDIPGVLGRGYRTFLYQHIASLQPEAVVMMNNGIGHETSYPAAYAWPSDIISLEREIPPDGGYPKWRNIEGKNYYMPGEVCDPIATQWFWVADDKLRSDDDLREQYQACRRGGVNLLLDVPPDRHGVIPEATTAALMRLRKSVEI